MDPNIPTRVRLIWPWVALGVLILGAVSAGAYYVGKSSNTKTLPTVVPTNAVTAKPTPTALPSVSTAPIVDEGVAWLPEPQVISNLGLLTIPKDLAGVTQKDIHYFKVGTDNGKDIILAEYIFPEPGPSYGIYQFIKTADNQYEYLSSLSEKQAENKTYSGLLLDSKKVVTQNPKVYKSIQYQQKLRIKNTEVSSTGNYASWFLDDKKYATQGEPASTVTEYTTTAYGTVYRLAAPRAEGYTTETYILRRPNGTSIRYQLRPPFLKDDYVPAITWNDGSANNGEYRIDGISACGVPSGISTLDSGAMKDLKATGKTSTGETVYEFADQNHKLVQGLFNTFNEIGKRMEPPKSVTIDEYMKKHALFVYKDKLDRLVLFNGGEYGALAECGKPVIYLYPEKTQKVSVKVDAEITVSDPAYGNGWNVTAHPNGTLVNADGKKYESLFWEGNGKEYPAITEGYVVPRAEVETTLRSHLYKLGLNAKEASDFMEFWLPKMPDTPYVRLTWFGTRQMDRLAPLNVQPKPDTTIRIFLDFEGMQQPITLPSQRLSAIPRKGFTLVEWGGLLRK